jgi:hypothetical protein
MLTPLPSYGSTPDVPKRMSASSCEGFSSIYTTNTLHTSATHLLKAPPMKTKHVFHKSQLALHKPSVHRKHTVQISYSALYKLPVHIDDSVHISQLTVTKLLCTFSKRCTLVTGLICPFSACACTGDTFGDQKKWQILAVEEVILVTFLVPEKGVHIAKQATITCSAK